jgi:hypothetical protein
LMSTLASAGVLVGSKRLDLMATIADFDGKCGVTFQGRKLTVE